MKFLCMATFCAILMSGACSLAGAEKLFSMSIGMTWPQALLNTGIPSGDAEIMYGAMIEKKVGFGVAADFLWNVQTHVAQDTGGLFKVTSDQKSFMFPIMGFFVIDPFPNLIVHPALHFEIGYNSMIYTVKNDTTNRSSSTPVSPYFYGLIVKTGIDANYNIGGMSSLFLGLDFQWANTETADTQNGLFNKRDMSGIGLRAGFRVTI